MDSTMYALITGASKGIGKAIATEMAAKGYNLLLVARSEDLLSTLAKSLAAQYKVNIHYLPIDLIEKNASSEVYKWTRDKGYAVHILINNAGFGAKGHFADLDIDNQQNIIYLNINAVVGLTHYFIPELTKHKASYIMNIGSMVAYQAIPSFAVYAATKSFVLSFSRALSHELSNKGVSVTCISPGPVSSEFAKVAQTEDLEQKLSSVVMSPEKLASIAISAMFKKKREEVPGLTNKAMATLTDMIPKIAVERFISKTYKL